MLTKIKQTANGNKLLFIIIPLIISWGIWATTSVFCLGTKQAVTEQSIKDVCADISEIKYKLDENNKQISETKEEILRLLLSINREVKSKRLP